MHFGGLNTIGVYQLAQDAVLDIVYISQISNLGDNC